MPATVLRYRSRAIRYFHGSRILSGVHLSPYRLLREEGWRIDLDGLERSIDERTRAIVLVHPNNPTGSFVRRDEAEALERMAIRYNLALIVDEVFSDYAFGEINADKLPTFVEREAALTFVLSGLSKVMLLPQCKLGWMVIRGPESLAREAIERLEVIADTYLSVSTPVQLALPAILKEHGQLLSRTQRRLDANLSALDDAIAKLGQDAPLRRLCVDGGWYAILEMPRIHDEDGWVELLLREDEVIVHPGYFFDLDRDGFLVLSLLPEEALFAEGVSRLIERVRREAG